MKNAQPWRANSINVASIQHGECVFVAPATFAPATLSLDGNSVEA